ncbi:UNVERIFIED_CONTAM: hypothetical protein Sradi_1320400 [Sesamum radiatum]|uniref:Uncharacterized protein n=1 Tax=Sesamum radiatum TaxID=300843 RepID=A0AAW2UPT4_SESRA
MQEAFFALIRDASTLVAHKSWLNLWRKSPLVRSLLHLIEVENYPQGGSRGGAAAGRGEQLIFFTPSCSNTRPIPPSIAATYCSLLAKRSGGSLFSIDRHSSMVKPFLPCDFS